MVQHIPQTQERNDDTGHDENNLHRYRITNFQGSCHWRPLQPIEHSLSHYLSPCCP